MGYFHWLAGLWLKRTSPRGHAVTLLSIDSVESWETPKLLVKNAVPVIKSFNIFFIQLEFCYFMIIKKMGQSPG